MDIVKRIKSELSGYASPSRAENMQRFFKTGPGEYAECDKFIGVTVPDIRKVAKRYFAEIELDDAKRILHSEIHEERLLALVVLVEKFKRADIDRKKEIFDLYLSNTAYINNWDLVDVNTPAIVGAYLLDKPRKILYELAKSKDLWERRISVLATFAFIRENDFVDSLLLAEMHLADEHDLMHKAVGWMLREIGKRDKAVLKGFLDKFSEKMPRTMLRYAIERLSLQEKALYMQK